MRMIEVDSLWKCPTCFYGRQGTCTNLGDCDHGEAYQPAYRQLKIIDAEPVVRCKDCKHGRPIDKTRSPEKYFLDDCVVCECESVVGDEPMIYRPTHFCSYGERRDDDD